MTRPSTIIPIATLAGTLGMAPGPLVQLLRLIERRGGPVRVLAKARAVRLPRDAWRDLTSLADRRARVGARRFPLTIDPADREAREPWQLAAERRLADLLPARRLDRPARPARVPSRNRFREALDRLRRL
jgi:hypothetical protein